MPRFDSYRSSTWSDGAVFTALTAAGTTLVSVPVPAPGFYLVGVSGSSDVAFNYNLIHYAADGATVRHQQQRILTAGGNEDWVFPGSFEAYSGDSFVVKLVGAVTPVVGLQLSLFPMLLG